MIPTRWPPVTQCIEALGYWWYITKTAAEHALGFSNDALHVMIGVSLQLVVARVMRVSAAHFLPWLAVLGLELLNEWWDLSFEIWPDHAMQWGESAKDVLLTMAVPSILLVVARRWPEVLSRSAIARPDPARTPELGEVE
jgi:hypothetical protein